MTRPCDWDVLALERDPTPGDPGAVAVLATQLHGVARDAAGAQRQVAGLAAEGPVRSWLGASAEVFRGALEEFPSQLGVLATSYRTAGEALGTLSRRLDRAQEQADDALARGRVARAELDSLSGQLSWATAVAVASDREAGRLADAPDPDQVRAAVRNARAAADRVARLADARADAQGRLEAARRLALDAGVLRERADRTAARVLLEAGDGALPHGSVWDGLRRAAEVAWQVTVVVATAVAAVAAIVALFVGGLAVVVVLLVAGVVLLVDALLRWSRGAGAWWEVLVAGLAVIPGGRLLQVIGRLTGLPRAGRAVWTGASTVPGVLGRMARAVRAGAGRAAGWLAAPLQRGSRASRTRALTPEEARSVRSLDRQAEAHRAKLAAYRADPAAFDHRGLLASAANDEVRARIVAGRVRHLENEIATFQKNLDKIRRPTHDR